MNDYKLNQLTTEELREISKQKKKNGCATDKAMSAQAILYKRFGECFSRFHGPNSAYDNGAYLLRKEHVL